LKIEIEVIIFKGYPHKRSTNDLNAQPVVSTVASSK